MIKVIKEGYVPKVIIPQYRIKCDHCHTVFECDKTDTWFKMMGHGEGGQYINCPKCGEGITEFMNTNWIIINLDEIREEERKEREANADN